MIRAIESFHVCWGATNVCVGDRGSRCNHHRLLRQTQQSAGCNIFCLVLLSIYNRASQRKSCRPCIVSIGPPTDCLCWLVRESSLIRCTRLDNHIGCARVTFHSKMAQRKNSRRYRLVRSPSKGRRMMRTTLELRAINGRGS